MYEMGLVLDTIDDEPGYHDEQEQEKGGEIYPGVLFESSSLF